MFRIFANFDIDINLQKWSNRITYFGCGSWSILIFFLDCFDSVHPRWWFLGQIILPEASASGRNHSQAKAVLVFAGDFGSSVLTEEFFGTLEMCSGKRYIFQERLERDSLAALNHLASKIAMVYLVYWGLSHQDRVVEQELDNQLTQSRGSNIECPGNYADDSDKEEEGYWQEDNKKERKGYWQEDNENEDKGYWQEDNENEDAGYWQEDNEKEKKGYWQHDTREKDKGFWQDDNEKEDKGYWQDQAIWQ